MSSNQELDQYRYCVYGQAVLNGGLAVLDGINGVGEITRGLVWQTYDTWYDQLSPLSGFTLSTSWSAYSGISITTSWSAYAGASIVTNWANSTNGIFSDSPVSW